MLYACLDSSLLTLHFGGTPYSRSPGLLVRSMPSSSKYVFDMSSRGSLDEGVDNATARALLTAASRRVVKNLGSLLFLQHAWRQGVPRV